jgi:hypothetical protein
MEDRERHSKEILERIREMAEAHGGDFLAVYHYGLFSGFGYITPPDRKEVSFEFNFSNSGFFIEVRTSEKVKTSSINSYIAYSDQARIDMVLNNIEEIMKRKNVSDS